MMLNHFCDKCDTATTNEENECGAFICADCEQNAAEAVERQNDRD